jgi:hypothetical protein
MSGWTMTLYGSDINYGYYPTTTDITDADKKTYSFSSLGAYIGFELEGEDVEYINGFIEGKNTLRMTLNPEVLQKDFPSTNTTLETFYPVDVFKKKYKYLHLGTNYYLYPSSYASTKCIQVATMGLTIKDNGNGSKTITFELKRTGRE